MVDLFGGSASSDASFTWLRSNEMHVHSFRSTAIRVHYIEQIRSDDLHGEQPIEHIDILNIEQCTNEVPNSDPRRRRTCLSLDSLDPRPESCSSDL